MVDRRAAGMVGWTEEDDLSEGCVVVEQIRAIHRGGEVVHGFRHNENNFIERVKFKRELKIHRTMCDLRQFRGIAKPA